MKPLHRCGKVVSYRLCRGDAADILCLLAGRGDVDAEK